MERTITVKGMGKASATPDLIVIEFTLEIADADYEKTMDTSARMLNALRSSIACTGLNGKCLKTTNFTVDTQYERYKDKNDIWKRRFEGYVCLHTLRLEFALDMKLLAEVLSSVADCEAKPEFTIKFTVKDPTAVSKQLLENAVKDAAYKAETLSKASGVKLGTIHRIDYSWGELRLYSETDMDMKCKSLSIPESQIMEIELDDIDVNDSVTVVWSIE